MAQKAQLRILPIEFLQRGKYQPRQHFAEDELRELAESIITLGGLLQPIVVRPLADNRYEIIAGERRWRAAQLAHFSQVPCLINDYNDEQTLQASMIENINRTNLNPIEEATGFLRLYEEFSYSHDEIAATVGKSRVKITNSLRLLKLNPKVQQFIIDGSLSEGHGKILAGLMPEQQLELANHTVTKGWSVRKLEHASKYIHSSAITDTDQKDPNVTALERNLSDYVGSPVNINRDGLGKGQLTVTFQNADILQGILEKLGYIETSNN